MRHRKAIIFAASWLTMFAGACLLHAEEPFGKQLQTQFEAALAKHGAAEQFAGHVKFAQKLFDDSRGEKSFRDKTGNCRLAWVEHLVTQPAGAVHSADEFSRALMVAANDPAKTLDVLMLGSEKLEAGIDKLEIAPARDGLERLTLAIAVAQVSFEQASEPLTADERTELRAKLYAQSTSEAGLGHRFADVKEGRRVCDLLEKLGRKDLSRCAAALAFGVDANTLKALAELPAEETPAVPGVEGKLHRVIKTPHGTILFGGVEANRYALDDLADVCAVVDLDGNDTYLEGTTTATRPVLIVIDLAGDDTYRGEKTGIQGAAVLGASLLYDAAGNDKYEAKDIAQGSALGGVGILIDVEGKDRYRGDRRVQGQAVAGLGILLDRQGDDDYRAALLAQGVGGPLGFGLLADVAGTDHYFAGGKYPGGYDDTPGFGGWSQGVGVGPRGVANGGIGVLLDGGGDDVYEADYFSHGGGYWFAAGIARDFGGNDQRVGATRENFDGTPRSVARFVRWGTGYGCHYAAGFVIDDAGDDLYEADFAVVSYAWDIAVGAVCDLAGNDRYTSHGSGVCQAHNAAVSLLYDRAGNDSYQGGLGATTAETPYHLEGGSGNFTLLLDEAGQDTYSEKFDNPSEQTRGWGGALLIDR